MDVAVSEEDVALKFTAGTVKDDDEVWGGDEVSVGEAVRWSLEVRKQICEAGGWAWLPPQTLVWLGLAVAGLGVQSRGSEPEMNVEWPGN